VAANSQILFGYYATMHDDRETGLAEQVGDRNVNPLNPI